MDHAHLVRCFEVFWRVVDVEHKLVQEKPYGIVHDLETGHEIMYLAFPFAEPFLECSNHQLRCRVEDRCSVARVVVM